MHLQSAFVVLPLHTTNNHSESEVHALNFNSTSLTKLLHLEFSDYSQSVLISFAGF